MSKISVNMPWNQRLAIIEQFSPSDKKACEVFGVSQDELDTARQMKKTGMLASAANFDPSRYAPMFSAAGIQNPTSTSTSTESFLPPQTASRRVRAPKKRGRKGTKILEAFKAIPSKPVPAEQFAAQHNVSIAVLRQSKRFDSESNAPVHVKRDKSSGLLMIWRGE